MPPRPSNRPLFALTALVALVLALLLAACGKPQPTVVVYTAHDRGFSEPILKRFEEQTGIRVEARYDTESTKTVGLVQALIGERDRPRCDVFWNNEIVNTIRLENEGLLAPHQSAATAAMPATFRDPNGRWTGFAARARILLVNTDLVPAGEEPTGIRDLANPKWKGRTGIAKPLFGTTATHAAVLFAQLGEEEAKAFFASLLANDLRIEGGNKGVAQAVSAGRLAFGLTDTDDAIGELEAGMPVKIVYPDGAPDQMGTLFIPNTVSLIAGGPHPEAGAKLIDFLLSPAVETELARGSAAQIPLNPAVNVPLKVKTPNDVKAMPVDFAAAAADFATAATYIEAHFLQ